MQMQELGTSIDQVLSEEFDGLILGEFCSKLESSIPFLKTSHEYNLQVVPASVQRAIEVYVSQKVHFSKVVSADGAMEPAKISIHDPSGHHRYKFSVNDLLAIFFPEMKTMAKENWRQALAAHLEILVGDLSNLFKKEIQVIIAAGDAGSQPFWTQGDFPVKQNFYYLNAEILKTIIAKGVPEITIGARSGSDSPYQRYINAQHWGLLSFRMGKRQQIDVAQYLDGRRIRMKCALLDMAFLENGYGKVARIKELISVDIASDLAKDKIEATQKDFVERSIKQISAFLP